MDALRAAGVGPAAIEGFLRPFLAGVLLEPDLATSRRYVDLLLRSFVRGATGLPANGMQAIGEQLAGGSIASACICGRRSRRSRRLGDHRGGTCRADAVVVATDPATAATLLPGLGSAHRAGDHPPARAAHLPLAVAADRAGRPGGQLVNTVVVSDAQPRYSPDGRALVASSTLAPTTEAAVREEIARATACRRRSWST